jgi:hypothetical protein
MPRQSFEFVPLAVSFAFPHHQLQEAFLDLENLA